MCVYIVLFVIVIFIFGNLIIWLCTKKLDSFLSSWIKFKMLAVERLVTDDGIFFPLFLFFTKFLFSYRRQGSKFLFFFFFLMARTLYHVRLSVHRSLKPIPIVGNVISVIGWSILSAHFCWIREIIELTETQCDLFFDRSEQYIHPLTVGMKGI